MKLKFISFANRYNKQDIKMTSFLKDYFNFNKSERQGIFVLLSLILFLILIKIFLPVLKNNSEFDSSEFEKEISDFERSKDKYFDSINNVRQKKIISKNRNKQVDLFNFDPNKTSLKEWERLGLSKKQIKVITNYKDKGGKFYKKDDLKKIYSISEKIYKCLEPYITISSIEKPKRNKTYKKYTNKPQKKIKTILELNTADSAGLTMLYGIGPAFSSRIIKYRKLLGGFSSKYQLLEIYGFDSTRLKMIINNITVEPVKIKKININSASFKELLKHPYISYEITSQIFKLKRKQGELKHLEELKKIDLVNDSVFQKIAPYLAVD